MLVGIFLSLSLHYRCGYFFTQVHFHCDYTNKEMNMMNFRRIVIKNIPLRYFSSKPVKCDPYGQKGLALELSEINKLLPTINKEWSISQDGKKLSRIYTCKKKDVIRHDSSLTFHLVNQLYNISTNMNHYPYDIHIIPRKSSFIITLKTIPLKGLSYNDFFLALQLDSAHQQLIEKK